MGILKRVENADSESMEQYIRSDCNFKNLRKYNIVIHNNIENYTVRRNYNCIIRYPDRYLTDQKSRY